jgi:hypothetical protein
VRLFVVMVTLTTVAFVTTPAAAHSCTVPTQTLVGVQATVAFGVPAETTPVDNVEVEIPPGFRVSEVGQPSEWRSNVATGRVRLTGGPIGPYSCVYFSLVGVAQRKGVHVLAFHTTATDGTVTAYDRPEASDVHAAQLIYAGVAPDPAADSTPTPVLTVMVGVMLLAGLVGVIVRVRRRPRSGIR